MIKFWHDGNIHNPPRGASTIFKEGYANYIFKYIPKDEVRISVGAVPNSPPHFGTIITFSLAFSLAQRLEKLGKIVTVIVGMVDTIALDTDIYSFNDVEYQKVLLILEKAPEIIMKLINEREKVGQSLFPSTKCLALRMACPQCGLADKSGIKNCYNDNIISFFCPNHGWYSIDIEKDDLQTLQYETQLRSLVRGLLYTEDNKDKDPLVLDWARVKLSKSILVKGGYKYLTKQEIDYFIHYRKFNEKFDRKGLEILFDEVNLWLDEPHKLFRKISLSD
ncbi:2455_t:CDS:2, partial [Racocetra persica]